MKFPAALNFALNARLHIRRTGWRNSFHLELSEAGATHTYLVRQHEQEEVRVPWGVITEDDVLADDWEVICDDPAKLTPEVLASSQDLNKGTTPWALAQLLDGKEVHMGNGPLFVKQIEIPEIGPAFVLFLPDGAKKLFRFAPLDLHKQWRIASEDPSAPVVTPSTTATA